MQPGDSGLDVGFDLTGVTGFDDERIVDLSDDAPLMDDVPVVPGGRGEARGELQRDLWGTGESEDDWLRDQRPPHW
jgi:hypothetical protein